jgi:SAM-dependent methyltransferase
MDFGYSLGVLHHVPDTAEALRNCAAVLRPGAPFLVYLYYAFDNRPWWYRALWRITDPVRRVVSRSPHTAKLAVTTIIALLVYLPLARLARLGRRFGARNMPLAYYADRSFYTMRTDAYDRFGTQLEQRFTRDQIELMLRDAGFENVVFSPSAPYWCAIATRSA